MERGIVGFSAWAKKRQESYAIFIEGVHKVITETLKAEKAKRKEKEEQDTVQTACRPAQTPVRIRRGPQTACEPSTCGFGHLARAQLQTRRQE